jgi:hypothetical protein
MELCRFKETSYQRIERIVGLESPIHNDQKEWATWGRTEDELRNRIPFWGLGRKQPYYNMQGHQGRKTRKETEEWGIAGGVEAWDRRVEDHLGLARYLFH